MVSIPRQIKYIFKAHPFLLIFLAGLLVFFSALTVSHDLLLTPAGQFAAQPPPPLAGSTYADPQAVQQLHIAVASGSTACTDYPLSITVSVIPPSGIFWQGNPIYYYSRKCAGPTYVSGELDEARATIVGYDCYIHYGPNSPNSVTDPATGVTSGGWWLDDPENLERKDVPPAETLRLIRSHLRL